MPTYREEIQAWCTRYALSRGIIEVVGKELPYGDFDVLTPKEMGMTVLSASEWSPALEAAKARAEQMRVKKISSLKRQIYRLEQLTF